MKQRGAGATVRRTGRWLQEQHPFIAAGLFAAAIALGAFERPGGAGWLAGLGLLVLGGLLALRLWVRSRQPTPVGDGDLRRRTEDLASGLLLLVGLHAVFRLSGGSLSPLYPLLLLFVAFVSLLAERRAAQWLIGGAALAEGLPLLAGDSLAIVFPWTAAHLLFIGLFALAYTLLLRSQVELQRARQRSALDGELRRIEDEARAFRLLSSSLGGEGRSGGAPGQERSAEDVLAKQLQEGVKGIRRTVCQQLALLRDAFGLHSSILYWLDASGTRLRVLEARSGSDRLSDRPVAPGEGIVGTVASTGDAVRLEGLRKSNRGLLHYREGEQVAVLMAVPVRDRGQVCGVLLGDRRHDLPFTQANQTVFESVAELLATTFQNERVFLATERLRRDQELFHRALKSLNRAQEADAVHQAVLGALVGVAPFDLAALTLYDPASELHRVVAAAGRQEAAAQLRGQEFDGRGLVAQVVRTGHYLPVGGEVGELPPQVFAEGQPLHGVRSLLVLPLPLGPEEVLGTLVLASDQPGVYDQETRERLEVIAHSAAVSIQNAGRFELIRRLATTDGLTGLVNHRTFQARYDEALARARRSGAPLALLLTDIDHFKAVNDTHGHPAGDEVLKAVARRLAQTVRTVDLVARYGGEEFVVLLEGTGPEGARAMGERLREAVAGETVLTGGKSLSVTLSLGVACFPAHGQERALLLERADQALYVAKNSGRNQVRLHDEPAATTR